MARADFRLRPPEIFFLSLVYFWLFQNRPHMCILWIFRNLTSSGRQNKKRIATHCGNPSKHCCETFYKNLQKKKFEPGLMKIWKSKNLEKTSKKSDFFEGRLKTSTLSFFEKFLVPLVLAFKCSFWYRTQVLTSKPWPDFPIFDLKQFF